LTGETRLQPKKSLGQHFLQDNNIARKIVHAVRPGREDVMIEIGPGEGALTGYLSGVVGKLLAIEIDERAVAGLRDAFPGGDVEIMQGDFLELDLEQTRVRLGQRVRIVGNIPYNITTPILFHILDHRSAVEDITLMMLKEVAMRITARPRTKEYGILSVLCQMFSDVERLFDVSPGAFRPPPRVKSSVLRFVPLSAPRHALRDEEFFRRMVRGVFGKRRKTLRNSLRYALGEEALAIPHGLDPGRRPEELSLQEFADLSNALVDGGVR
jgi:16S rRNA (adenine1518-N6/adenine1519-N6)-dimethyltransferase